MQSLQGNLGYGNYIRVDNCVGRCRDKAGVVSFVKKGGWDGILSLAKCVIIDDCKIHILLVHSCLLVYSNPNKVFSFTELH